MSQSDFYKNLPKKYVLLRKETNDLIVEIFKDRGFLKAMVFDKKKKRGWCGPI